REELKAAIDQDAAAFDALVKASKQAKDASANDSAVAEATRGAIAVPLRVAERSREVEQLAEKLRPITNPRMASDLTVAAALARAAREGGLANVAINLESQSDGGVDCVNAATARPKVLCPWSSSFSARMGHEFGYNEIPAFQPTRRETSSDEQELSCGRVYEAVVGVIGSDRCVCCTSVCRRAGHVGPHGDP